MKCLNCNNEDIHGKELCQSCYNKDYSQKHREYFRNYDRQWREKNREKRLEQGRQSYYRHREQRLLKVKEYRLQYIDKIKEYDKMWRFKNKDKIRTRELKNKDRRNEQQRMWYLKNKDREDKKNREQYYKNREKRLEYQKYYYITNKDNIIKYQAEYYCRRIKYDIEYKLRIALSTRIQIAVKNNGTTKSKKTMELLGCTIPFFREYIEKQFKQGMTWQNYGTDWHLDHIIPCVHFILTEAEQQRLCFHYTNYQPLWKEENLSKGAKILE